MPNIHSAEKRMRASAKQREHNLTVTSELKTMSKRLYTLAAKEPSKAAEYARLVIKKYDTAASNGIIPRSRADRKKSRVSSLIAKISSKKK